MSGLRGNWKEEALGLLKNALEIVTVTNQNNEKELAEYIAGFLKDTIKAEIQELSPGRANVIGEIRGEDENNAILLNGHLDTVPFGDLENWQTPPHKATEKDGYIYARGASDMKSGLCAYLYAFCTLAKEGYKPKNSIIFTGTADEEINGLGAYGIVQKGLLDRVSKIIIGEPTGNGISVAAKGTLWIEFHIDGKTCHSSYPHNGVNACEKAYELYQRIKALTGDETHYLLGKTTCTMTKMNGGVANNMVPDKCSFSVDIRTIPGVSHKALLGAIDREISAMANTNKELFIEKNIITNRISVEIEEKSSFVKEFSRSAEKVKGEKPRITSTNFFSDASIFCMDYSPSVLLFGPGESGEAHKPNEYVEIKKYFEAIEIMYEFLKTL